MINAPWDIELEDKKKYRQYDKERKARIDIIIKQYVKRMEEENGRQSATVEEYIKTGGTES
jgi:hypothetical protein